MTHDLRKIARNAIMFTSVDSSGDLHVDIDAATEAVCEFVKDPDEAFQIVDLALDGLIDEGFVAPRKNDYVLV